MGQSSLIADRLIRQINDNGDERIDHDEFVSFFMKLLMGSVEDKLRIAYKCYDVDDDQIISEDEVKIVLLNIPQTYEPRMNIKDGFDQSNRMSHLNRVEHVNQKFEDQKQVSKICELIFEYHPNGIYFNEFCRLCREVTCELYFPIFDQIYQNVPCVKNFFVMRAHYLAYLRAHSKGSINFIKQEILMPPISTKLVDRLTEYREVPKPKTLQIAAPVIIKSGRAKSMRKLYSLKKH